MNIPQVLLNKPAPGTQINLSHPLARGLVGCWLFNEQSGRQAYDLSPYHNHGTLHGFNDPSSKDRSSLGLQFDGSNDYVDCGNDPSLNITDAITIEAWVKFTNNPSGQMEGILGKRASYFMRIYSFSNVVLGYIYLDSLAWVSSLTIPTAGRWYHYVMTYDKNRGASNLKMYLNGIQKETKTKTGNISITNYNFKIGTELYDNTFHNGTIDEVRIYNRALSVDEITWSYREPYDMFKI